MCGHLFATKGKARRVPAAGHRRAEGIGMEYDIRPGIYRHFKGNEYRVLCLARHSETGEEMVVYRALYGERGIWVRPASMWNETVERDGERIRRFDYISPATEKEEL